MKEQKKNITLKFRLSEQDYRIINKKADLLNLSISEYLRLAGTSKQVKGFKMMDIQKLDPKQQVKGQMEISNFL